MGAEDAARHFYCELLGMAEIEKPPSLNGRGGFWLEAGELQIHVGVESDVDRNKTKAHVAYLVDDIESARYKLIAQSVEIIDGIPVPGYLRFEFRDPFGNRVEFLQAIR